MKKKPPTIVITPGEPAGIGPDLVLQLIQQKFPAELVIIADRDMLKQRAKRLKISLEKMENKRVRIIHIPLAKQCIPGNLNKTNAAYVIQTLKLAGEGCLDKQFDAVVTGPVQKSLINEAGIAFSGHTEFFAELAKVSQVVMMLVAKKMRIALVTTHLPLADVPQAITSQKLESVIKILQDDLRTKFAIKNPKIFISGLNPHAGENGYIGREEFEIIIPTLEKLRANGMQLIGPLPADTMFLKKNLKSADVFLMMYHDQGLPVIKFYGFDEAVNVTLGLPFIRTSVDHGTALELAGTKKANPSSFKAAVNMAILMCDNSSIRHENYEA